MSESEQDFKERIAEHYNQDAKTFKQKEKIEYQNINRWVKHFIAAGEAQENNYVYVANKLVEDVFAGGRENLFNEDKEDLKKRFSVFRQELYEDKYSRTIFLMGIDVWVQLFRAFFIVAEDWAKDKANENYICLIYLFFCEKERTRFDLSLVRNLSSCIDGISEKRMNEAFLYLLEKINDLKIMGNMNHSEYFHVFLQRSLVGIYFLGYDNRIDPFQIKVMFIKGNEPDVEELISLLTEIKERIQEYKAVFEKSKKRNAFEKEIKNYGIVERYLLKLEAVISNPATVKEIDDGIKVTTSFPTAEKMEEYAQLEEEAFYESVKNDESLTAYQKYELINNRIKKTGN